MKIIFRDWNSNYPIEFLQDGNPEDYWPSKRWHYGPNRDKYFVREVSVDKNENIVTVYVEEQGYDEY